MSRGDVFGKLTFVGTVDRDQHGRKYGAFRCECGQMVKRYENSKRLQKGTPSCEMCRRKTCGTRSQTTMSMLSNARQTERVCADIEADLVEEFGETNDVPKMFAGAIYTYLDD